MKPPRRMALAAALLLCAATLSPTVVTAEALLDGSALALVELPSLVAFPAAVGALVGILRQSLARRGLAVASLAALAYGALVVAAHGQLARTAMSGGAFEMTGHAVLAGSLGLGAAAAGESVTDRVPRRLPLAIPVALVVAAAFVPFDPLQRAVVRGHLPFAAVALFGLVQVWRYEAGAVDATTLLGEWAGAVLVLVVTLAASGLCLPVGTVGDPPTNFRVSYSLAENRLRYGTQYSQCALTPNLWAFVVGWALLLAAPLARFVFARFEDRSAPAQS